MHSVEHRKFLLIDSKSRGPAPDSRCHLDGECEGGDPTQQRHVPLHWSGQRGHDSPVCDGPGPLPHPALLPRVSRAGACIPIHGQRVPTGGQGVHGQGVHGAGTRTALTRHAQHMQGADQGEEQRTGGSLHLPRASPHSRGGSNSANQTFGYDCWCAPERGGALQAG